MMKHRNMFQAEQDKNAEADLNEMETIVLPDKEFRIMVIKMLTEVRKIYKQSKYLNKEIVNIRKYQIYHKAKKTKTELKNSMKGSTTD